MMTTCMMFTLIDLMTVYFVTTNLTRMRLFIITFINNTDGDNVYIVSGRHDNQYVCNIEINKSYSNYYYCDNCKDYFKLRIERRLAGFQKTSLLL